jgi:hypothetical protein
MAERRGEFKGRLSRVPRAQEFIDAYQGWAGEGMEMGAQPMPGEYTKMLKGYGDEDEQKKFLGMFLEQALRDRYKEFYPGAAPVGDPLITEAEGLSGKGYEY